MCRVQGTARPVTTMCAAPAAVAAASASRVRCETDSSERSSVPSRSVAISRYGKP